MTAPQRYLLQGLEASPVILSQLMKAAAPAILDRKPDPERFSLREVVAHLADWDTIWHERVEKIAQKAGVEILSRDPDELASKNNYSKQDPATAIKDFQEKRAKLINKLKSLDEAAWSQHGVHSQFGNISIQDIAQIALGHDGYHLQQVADWISWKTK